MRLWLLLRSILFTLITVRAEELKFGQDEYTLRRCIEEYLSKDFDSKIVLASKSLAEIAARRFHHKSYDRRQFEDSIRHMCYGIKSKKSYLFDDSKVSEKLKVSMRSALENCVERKSLPKFDDEPQVLADLLDHVLVDWPIPVNVMILTHEDRSTLRMYAYSVGLRLMSALKYFSMNYQIFRRELRRIWMLRAEKLYDAGAKIIYIQHRFATNKYGNDPSRSLRNVYTVDDVISFIERRSIDFSFRNMVIRQRKTLCPEDDVYIKYSQHSVTSAENYLELHLDRCYRVLFFVLELQSRGISSDEDDFFNEFLPNYVVPFRTQEIVWNHDAYRIYLTTLRHHFELFPTEEIGGCSSSGTIEELIIRLTLLIAKKTVSSTTAFITTTVTSITATSTTTITESAAYEEGSKKGGARTRDCGKYFIPNKRSRAMVPEQTQKSGFFDNNFNYYGHISYNGSSSQLRFFEKAPSMISEIIVGLTFDNVLAKANFLSCV